METMKKIIDEQGNILPNHYRLGSLIYVEDEKSKNLYNINLNNINKIKKLEDEVNELKNILYELLKELREKNNFLT